MYCFLDTLRYRDKEEIKDRDKKNEYNKNTRYFQR